MKSYKATKIHPQLKEGVPIGTIYTAIGGMLYYSVCNKTRHIDADFEQGYIKELEEKEFTKSNMIDFSLWILGESSREMREKKLYVWYEDWLKNREK